jgi:hypothetical protein
VVEEIGLFERVAEIVEGAAVQGVNTDHVHVHLKNGDKRKLKHGGGSDGLEAVAVLLVVVTAAPAWT